MKAVICMIALVVFCVSGQGLAHAVDLKYAGSTTCQIGFMFDAAAAYKREARKTISIMGGSSSAGVKGVSLGTIDLGGISRPIAQKERDAGIVPYTIAWDAIAVIVNKKNPINNISMQELKKVNTGEILNWKNLGGGSDNEIVVVTSHVGSATKEVFQNIVMKKEAYRSDVHTVNSTRDEVDKVIENEYAIGAVSLAFADPAQVKIISVDNIKPTLENIRTEKYKISRPLSLVTRGPAQGEAKKFIDFMLGEQGQKIIGATDFVHVN